MYTLPTVLHSYCRTAYLKNSKCTKIVGGRGLAPDPNGKLTVLLQTPSWSGLGEEGR